MSLVELQVEDRYRLHRRFDRMGRLVGDAGMRALFDAHVVVVGIGGVGSFAAEALARSGVGRLTLVDFDLVCITNSNRQIHTLKGTIGKPKVEVMAERLRRINPQIQVDARRVFYSEHASNEVISNDADWVVDAIDNITAKCHLLATCKERQIPVICSTGAAARMDPTRVAVTDLAKTRVDPLARAVRKILREQYDFPRDNDRPFRIPAVFSDEQPLAPQPLDYDEGKGFRCVCPQGNNNLHGCEDRNRIDGTSGFVTGTFGLVCASWVVRRICEAPGNS